MDEIEADESASGSGFEKRTPTVKDLAIKALVDLDYTGFEFRCELHKDNEMPDCQCDIKEQFQKCDASMGDCIAVKSKEKQKNARQTQEQSVRRAWEA